ncbi:MAG TPA: RNA-binding S4 domain-containing protein [Magnetospirillaceae bacterium]
MSTTLRIDKWLWFARFCKTRSQAQRLLDDGMVTVNGRLVDKSSAVMPGDEIVVPFGHHAETRTVRRLRVVALGERRGSAAIARLLYEELLP